MHGMYSSDFAFKPPNNYEHSPPLEPAPTFSCDGRLMSYGRLC